MTEPYSTGNNAPLVPYDPEIIELFFIVDGDLAIYLIPSRVIAGRVQILLRTYRVHCGERGGARVLAPVRGMTMAAARHAVAGA
jgi:hypothetical protein